MGHSLTSYKYKNNWSCSCTHTLLSYELFCIAALKLLSCCCCLAAQSCLTLCDPMDCNPPGSFVYGILQARILEWVSIPFSRGSSWPRDWTQVSCITGGFLLLSLQGSPKHLSIYIFLKYLFIWLHKRLSCGMQDLQLRHVGSSSLARDWTWSPCIGSAESEPLDHRASPETTCFEKILWISSKGTGRSGGWVWKGFWTQCLDHTGL